MWMRIAGASAVAGLAFVLMTCGADSAPIAGDTPDAESPGGGATPTPAPSPTTTGDVQSVACALNNAGAFENNCTVERREIDGQKILVVLHPDGGFRRFEQLADGSGLTAVAGADKVAQTLSGDTLEIAIAGDRYRFAASTQ